MAEGGSFYPSIHPGWHFEEADFEFPRPAYMQASLAADWFKGGWSASWESTGGPQQLSGGKAPFVEDVRDRVAGFTIDAGTIRQLLLSYVAAGFRGFGLWCWNARAFGWEAGEYALLDRGQRPCARTIAAGRIGAACSRLRDELWQARKEPLVGLFQDFEADAFYAALAVGGRDMYRQWPARARIGAARALIDANIPWEHVTARDLRAGLAGRYRILFLPAQLAVDPAMLESLVPWVEGGGRLVLDAPGAWYGYDGRLLPTEEGSAFERLFGCRIADFQYSRANHVLWSIGGRPMEGFTLELVPTRARVRERFDDGRPCVSEHRLGAGSAVVLAHEAALACWRPGNRWMQHRLVRHLLGARRPSFACAGAIVYRLAAPGADHYFLLADGPARRVRLRLRGHTYAAWEDPIAEQTLSVGAPIEIGAHDARWIRCLHATGR
jgi:beta-galactosidase